MNNRERTRAILNYQDYDRLPVVHFGYWAETLEKWIREGHLTPVEIEGYGDGTEADDHIAARLGFDYNYYHCFGGFATHVYPPLESRVLEVLPDGSRKVVNSNGVILLEKDDVQGIPPEIDHLLKGRKEWEEIFKPRFQMTASRINAQVVRPMGTPLLFDQGGLEVLRRGEWPNPYGLYCGSLYGCVRDILGLTGTAYLQSDDPELYDEIIDTVGELCYQWTKQVLETAGASFDFGHYWEDICYNRGPLISPRVFREKVGPHYRRITELLHSYGITLISLDCDGKIDALVPIWLENGVNTMFPIEVGIWNASIQPWREKYGRQIRGVGGMDKRVFAYDYAAVDAEIERLKPLVELGGYIPCPDHRIPPDARWENVQYYCEKLRRTFGG